MILDLDLDEQNPSEASNQLREDFRIRKFPELNPVLFYLGLYSKGESNHRFWSRLLHRIFISSSLVVFLSLAIVYQVSVTFTIAESLTIFGYFLSYGFLMFFIHTRSLDRLTVVVAKVKEDLPKIQKMIKYHVIWLCIVDFASVGLWQAMCFYTLVSREYASGLLIARIVLAVMYLILSPIILSFFMMFSIVCSMHKTQIRTFQRNLRNQSITLNEARSEYDLIIRTLQETVKTWDTILVIIEFFCTVVFLVWMYQIFVQDRNIAWVFFAVLPATLGFFLLFCAALVSKALGRFFPLELLSLIHLDSIKDDVHNLMGKVEFKNPSYTRSEVDSFANYVLSKNICYSVAQVDITFGRVTGLLYSFGTVVLIAVRAYLSGTMDVSV